MASKRIDELGTATILSTDLLPVYDVSGLVTVKSLVHETFFAGALQPTAAAGAGTDLVVRAQNAGSGNSNGGNLVLTPGDNAGSGVDGFVVVRQPGGVAGTDDIRIWHDGTTAFIRNMNAGTEEVIIGNGSAGVTIRGNSGTVLSGSGGFQPGGAGNVFDSDELSLASGSPLRWFGGAVYDVGFARVAAGVVAVTDSSTGAGIVEMRQIASGGTPSSNSARLYAKDVAGNAEMFVKDEAGTETQISPHARNSPGSDIDAGDPDPVVIHHKNPYTGREEWIHLSAMARALGAQLGKKFLLSRELPAEERRDWDADQKEKQARYDAERQAEVARLAAWSARPPAERGDRPPPPRAAIDIRKPNPFK